MDKNTIINQLFANYPHFFASEKKIADYIIKYHTKVVNMTIKELAKACGASEATISRFCRKCDVKSFHHLKIELARERIETDTSIKVSNNITRDNISQSLQNILANKIAEISATINMIDTNTLDKIISAIQSAKRVQIIAVGNTIPVALECHL